jgi:hypothetical protein
MKNIKQNNNIRRVTDEVATNLVHKGWKYCAKWENIKDPEAAARKRGKNSQ